MRLLILGASGGCGQWITRLAHERGHDVTALVRHDSSYRPPTGVTLHLGDVTDRDVLDHVLPGRDAVLCALGLRRAGRNPWARLQSHADLMQHVARLLTDAMLHANVERLIAISAAGVGESKAQCTLPVRLLIRSGNIAVAYRDLEAMETILAASRLDWMVVRPVTLLDGPPKRRARSVARYRLSSVVRRSEVATFMLDVLEMPRPFPEQRVMIG
jgi:uncharacterized protein YbjT (DUF2867 family)